MFAKIWEAHVVARLADGTDLIHVDRHVVHEMMSAKAFADLDAVGRRVRNPELTLCVLDHILDTRPGRDAHSFPQGTTLINRLRENAARHRLELIDIDDPRQGIVHVVSPDLGYTLPGLTLACCDSHTCTNGALGAVAFGIGTSDVAHILATQTLAMARQNTFRVRIDGALAQGVTAKDLVLYLIARLGIAAGTGFAVEYAGPAVRALGVESRLTLCNMSIEWGARIGFIAPDDAVFEYVAGRPYSPRERQWDRALAAWRALPSDDGAVFDREVAIDATRVAPQITWGTTPEDSIAIDAPVPDPDRETDPGRKAAKRRALDYMGVVPGQSLLGLAVETVFIGSCTNSRLPDLRAAAATVKGRKVAAHVRAMVVPGSTRIKRDAEAEGLDRVFKDAGFEWHESACSMCAAVNADRVPSGARCVSTSNRNFEGRQGRGARTHLASPVTAAAAAIAGKIVDVRDPAAPP